MKLNGFLVLIGLTLSSFGSFGSTWTICNSGTWGTNTGNTTLTISKDGGACINVRNAAFAPAANDIIVFPAEYTVTFASNVQITNAVTMEIYGDLIFDNGKIDLTAATSKINLYPGASFTCTGTDCGNNNQITVDDQQFKGQDLEDINNGPRPVRIDTNGTPIVLAKFIAEEESSGSVALSWTTLSEIDFDKFEVQRSTDGKQYQKIGDVSSARKNVADIETHYSFDDPVPTIGFSYYRLKAIDLDGKFEIFGPVVTRINAEKSVSVFPNPVIPDQIRFQTNFTAEDPDFISIIDQHGAEIVRMRATEAHNVITFQKDLPAGIYLLKYSSKGFEHSVRFRVL